MDTILLVHGDAAVREHWAAAFAEGARVIALDSIGSLPRLLARREVTLIVTEADHPALKVLKALALFLDVPPVALVSSAPKAA